jgi:hypothetical protein
VSRIRSGRDIFPVGSVIQTPQGSLRVLSIQRFPDYVEYETEPVMPRVLSHHQRPSAGARLSATVRRWLSR